MVDATKDDREGLKPDVQQAVDQGDVEVEQEADRFGEAQAEGPDQGHLDDLVAGHALGFNLGLAFQVTAGKLSVAACATVEDVVGAGLGEKEDQKN